MVSRFLPNGDTGNTLTEYASLTPKQIMGRREIYSQPSCPNVLWMMIESQEYAARFNRPPASHLDLSHQIS